MAWSLYIILFFDGDNKFLCLLLKRFIMWDSSRCIYPVLLVGFSWYYLLKYINNIFLRSILQVGVCILYSAVCVHIMNALKFFLKFFKNIRGKICSKDSLFLVLKFEKNLKSSHSKRWPWKKRERWTAVWTSSPGALNWTLSDTAIFRPSVRVSGTIYRPFRQGVGNHIRTFCPCVRNHL